VVLSGLQPLVVVALNPHALEHQVSKAHDLGSVVGSSEPKYLACSHVRSLYQPLRLMTATATIAIRYCATMVVWVP
jgi:hypothetical protein